MDNPEFVSYYTELPDSDFKPFDFGDDLTEHLDELELETDAIPDEAIYDAINDETFGEELTTLATENDLADFAKMTATLVLDDEPGRSSTQPPDPSQLPVPHIRNYNSSGFNQNERVKKDQITDTNLKLEPVDMPTSSIWASGSFNGIGSLNSELYIGQQAKANHPPVEQLIRSAPRSKNPTSSYPLNAEELERKLVEEAVSTNTLHSKLPFTSHSHLLDSSELERHLLAEAMTARSTVGQEYTRQEAMPNELACNIQEERQRQQQEIAAHAMIAASMAATTFPQQQGPTAAVFSNIPAVSEATQIMQPAALYRLFQQQLQPQVPTHQIPTSQFFQQWKQQLTQNFSGIQSIPPCFLPPPPGMSPIPPILHHTMQLLHQNRQTNVTNTGNPVIPSYLIGTSPMSMTLNPIQSKIEVGKKSALSQYHMVPASLHPRVERQRRQKSHNLALPSGKTITDYALDPYAGLMSTKEREWLIKIHIIQCLGTGDPMDDDYYYTLWKQRNVLTKAPDEWTKREKPKYYSFETTFPAIGYTAPSFMGALGKPIHCTSSQPRQMIEVNSECPDEESVNGKQTAANRQKRLRAMLMKIENAAMMLIDCRDIRRKLHFFEDTRITEFIEKDEITSRVARFAENLTQLEVSIFAPDQLPTVMLIQKGRKLVYDWLHFLCLNERPQQNGVSTVCTTNHGFNSSKVLAYMCMCICMLAKFARKLPDDSITDFSQGFCSLFSQFSSYAELSKLLQASRNFESSLISDSKFVQLTLLSLLASLIRCKNGALQIQELEGTGVSYLLFYMLDHHLKLQPNKDEHLLGTTEWKLIRVWLAEQKQSNVNWPHNKESILAQKIILF